jgi:hypothetical protein
MGKTADTFEREWWRAGWGLNPRPEECGLCYRDCGSVGPLGQSIAGECFVHMCSGPLLSHGRDRACAYPAIASGCALLKASKSALIACLRWSNFIDYTSPDHRFIPDTI